MSYPRYPAYKDSDVEWLGMIPDCWQAKRLKYVAPVVNVKIDQKPVDKKYVGLENVQSGTGQLLLEAQADNVESVVSAFNTGDVLFGKLRPYLAKVVLAPFDGVCTTELLVLRSRQELDHKFLFYALLSDGFIKLIDSSTYGSKMPRANAEQIENTLLSLPSLPEQHAIAAFLDRETARIDALIAKQETLIALLGEKRKALISHAVTKGLDRNAPMKDSGVAWLGEVPAHWDVVQFRRVCQLHQGLQIAQAERFAEPGPGRVEYITIKSIHAGDLNEVKEYIENPPNRVICNPDDVLFARTGATGEVVTNQQGAFHNNFFCVNYERNLVKRHFLIYYLQNSIIRNYLLLQAGTTTIPDLNHGEFLATPFLLPSLEEQSVVVDYLDSATTHIDTLISKAEQLIALLREHRTALIAAAVTGKIDVRGMVDGLEMGDGA